MPRSDPHDRRSALRLLAAGATTALVAGCTEGTGEGEDVPAADERDEGIDDVAEDGEPPGEPADWEGVDTVELVVDEDDHSWVGRRPAVVEDVENPALLLFEGREYEFRWTNRDGDVHNLAIWDDDHEPLAATESIDDEDESAGFVVEASDDMMVYLCETHGAEMAGSLEIRAG